MTENAWQETQPPGNHFFNSLRESGWFRAEPRWIAGVCSGISVRTGWDVRLVRAVVAVLSFALVFPVILYAAAWFLLPDGPRGPIQLQLFLQGKFTGAQLGAAALFFGGLIATPAGFAWFPASIIWASVALGIAGLTVFLVSVTSGKQTSNEPSSSRPAPQAERFSAMNSSRPSGGYGPPPPPQGSPNWAPPPGGSPPGGSPYRSYPGTQPRYYYPAPLKSVPTISNTTSFLTLGVLLLIAAAGIAAMFLSPEPGKVVLLTTGTIVLITGAVLAWGAHGGKRGGWLLGFSIVGAVLLLPAVIIGLAIGAAISPNHGEHAAAPAYVEEQVYELDEEESQPQLESAHARIDHTAGSFFATDSKLVLDLTNIPRGTEFSEAYELEDSTLTVLLSSKQLPVVDAAVREDSQLKVVSEDRAVNQAALERWAESDFEVSKAPLKWDSQVDVEFDLVRSKVTFVIMSPEEAEAGRGAVWPKSVPLVTAEEEPAQSGR